MFRQPLQKSWLNKIHLLPKTTINTKSYDSVKLSALFRLVLDLDQPLFFFRFSKGSARARERWAAKPPDPRKKGAWSFACLGRFAQRAKKKRETARSLG